MGNYIASVQYFECDRLYRVSFLPDNRDGPVYSRVSAEEGIDTTDAQEMQVLIVDIIQIEVFDPKLSLINEVKHQL